MERMWTSEAAMKYPKQWLVMVNLGWEPNNRVFGDVYLITDNKDEAYAKAIEIKKNEKDGDAAMVVEGFDDTPRIGGLRVCDL